MECMPECVIERYKEEGAVFEFGGSDELLEPDFIQVDVTIEVLSRLFARTFVIFSRGTMLARRGRGGGVRPEEASRQRNLDGRGVGKAARNRERDRHGDRLRHLRG